jgi:hypothetical protein
MQINVLTPGFTTSNGSAFLFPFVVHEHALRDVGVEVQFVNRNDPTLVECDILAIDSKEFRLDWAVDETRTLELISDWRENVPQVVWFDTTDSTGTLQSAVFAVVDRYLKSQILSDKSNYSRRVYGGRIYSEYYHDTQGIDDSGTEAVDEPITRDDIEKVGVSWNSGLADYSTYGPWRIGLYERLGWKWLLRHPGVLREAVTDRSNDLAARFGATYSRATVRRQRELIREKLSSRLDTKKINRRGYMLELKNSKVILSPFGWGEITLKDFEVFLTGGMLLKPSLDHMLTWPDFYEKDKTYLAHDWDLSDLEDCIDWAVAHDAERREIATEGQRRYIEFTSGPNAGERFASHVLKVMSS